MDTGEAVVCDEDEESDALFTMDDIESGAADTSKSSNKEEVSRRLSQRATQRPTKTLSQLVS